MQIDKMTILTLLTLSLSACKNLQTMAHLPISSLSANNLTNINKLAEQLSAPIIRDKQCYPLEILTPFQLKQLRVGQSNPILVTASKDKFVCSCIQGLAIEKLEGKSELSRIYGADDKSHLLGYQEKEDQQGKYEQANTNGRSEKGQAMHGDHEDNRRVAGANEGNLANGKFETANLQGLFETEGLAGLGEEGEITEKFSELSCREVPSCPGFQLIGYQEDQISAQFANGELSVFTSCVIAHSQYASPNP